MDKLLENLLLVHFHLFELDDKQAFEQFEGGEKAKFNHVIMIFAEKFGYTKSATAILKIRLSRRRNRSGSKEAFTSLGKNDPIHISAKSFGSKLTLL